MNTLREAPLQPIVSRRVGAHQSVRRGDVSADARGCDSRRPSPQTRAAGCVNVAQRVARGRPPLARRPAGEKARGRNGRNAAARRDEQHRQFPEARNLFKDVANRSQAQKA